MQGVKTVPSGVVDELQVTRARALVINFVLGLPRLRVLLIGFCNLRPGLIA